MLSVFPFEEAFYREHGVPVTFVGHPLADIIPLRHDQAAIRRELKLPADRRIVALLPGSRSSELKRHADLFVETATWLFRRYPNFILWHRLRVSTPGRTSYGRSNVVPLARCR